MLLLVFKLGNPILLTVCSWGPLKSYKRCNFLPSGANLVRSYGLIDNESAFKQLTTMAQAGDSVAYRELLGGLYSFLRNYLKRRIFEQNEIEEVVQEVLMAVHKSLHTYDSQRPFMGWFMSIVEYKVTDYIRAQQKQKANVTLESIAEVLKSVAADSDLKLDIEKAISNLSHNEKSVLTELKLKGHSVMEVAKALKLSESNVKVIAHRAYVNLKKQFGAGR